MPGDPSVVTPSSDSDNFHLTSLTSSSSFLYLHSCHNLLSHCTNKLYTLEIHYHVLQEEIMVRTRGQVRAQQYFNQLHSTSSDDSEVSFNPAWLDTELLGRNPGADSTDPEEDRQDYDMADRHERRIQLLESAVMGMTEKFDELLSAVNPENVRPASIETARPVSPARHVPAGRGRVGGHYGESRPPPLDPRDGAYADFVTQQLRREEFAVPRLDEGKSMAPDPFVKELLVKPYMYINRPGMSTMRKKLEARDTMTFHEYLGSFVKMIRDPRAKLHDLLDVHLEHLQQVIEDAAVRDWPSVRRWSQSAFDKVENGTLDWDDRYAMQLDRMHHAILAAKPQQAHNPTPPSDRKDLPCRDYNALTGCSIPRAHSGRTVNFVHVCSMCFAVGDRQYHPAHACPRRQQGQPQQSQHTQYPRYQYQAPAPTNSAPKNLIPASQQTQGMVRPSPTNFTPQ